MMNAFKSLARSRSGGSAAEFTLVLPVLLLFLLGVIDVGRLMWTWNKAEKATQMGARFAVVTDLIPSGLAGYSFVGVGGLTQGDVVPDTAYGTMECSSAATCTCTSGTCGWGTATTAGVFTKIYNRMKGVMPELSTSNVRVVYSPSGVGFAGDPNGSDIAPLVTVKLTGMTFKPLLFNFFGGTITLPDFRTSLTLEDGAGTYSN